MEGQRRGFVYPFALRRLALLHTRMGHADRAREYWRKFLATLSQPDPELQPLVAEAKAAVERL